MFGLEYRATNVNITPALPNPHQPSVGQDHRGITAVRAPERARDAADQHAYRQQATKAVDQAERERRIAQAENRFYQRQSTSPAVHRALASYAAVADVGERNGLRDLLGFDAYA